jgi:hypothetical protein
MTEAIYTKNFTDSSLLVFKKCFSILSITISCLYIVLFFPVIPIIAPLGLLASAYSKMSTIGVAFCFLGTCSIPFSMPFSSYFIWIKLAENKYGKVLFYLIFPFLYSLGIFLWFLFINAIHIAFQS